MKVKYAVLALALTGFAGLAAPAMAEEQVSPPRQKWSFAGPFGKYDEAQLQRGFKIYREVCSSCHSMNLVAIGSLADPGGPGFSEAQVVQIASEYKIQDIDDKGQPVERTGRAADHFPAPFPNALAAAAANGVAPPDMSTLAKARGYTSGFPLFLFDIITQYQEQGPDYIAAVLTGYKETPKDFKLPAGGQYNEYFPGHNIGMPPPLVSDGQVKYDDGTPETVQQYSRDVAAFLMWAAEPKLVQRKRIGFQVLIFLLVLTGLLYFTKKKVWSGVH
jgi:cytochrome c1